MCLHQTIAENYFVLVHANFNMPKIQNSECQAGFGALHKTVYELCGLPVKGTHENSAYIHIWARLGYIHNTFSKKWLSEETSLPQNSVYIVKCVLI